jgi:hypothetical protein
LLRERDIGALENGERKREQRVMPQTDVQRA